jgi:hypothetical protein
MNKKTFPRILSLLLTVTMLISSMVVMTIPATAEEADTPSYTAPEIVVKGEVDTWDKTTKTEPTQVADDGYILITSAAEFMWFMTNDTGSNNYRLTTSVSLNWQQVGNSKNLAGILDGDGYTISDLSRSAYSSLYFFKSVSGTIKNLNFKNFRLITSNACAAIVEALTGRLENCHFNFSKLETQSGGAAARHASGNAVITDCIISGTIVTGGTVVSVLALVVLQSI